MRIVMKKGLRLTAACIAMLFILTMTGCGVNHKSPEGVVEALIKEYVAGSEKKVKSCYVQQDKEDDVLQKEITATLKYFQVHEASEVNIKECETLAEKEDYVYVYVIYNLVLKDKQEYPCISTYMVQKDGRKYYVLPPSMVTTDMSKEAAADYSKFMTTDSYKNYTKEYDAFIMKNPGYEELIAGKL